MTTIQCILAIIGILIIFAAMIIVIAFITSDLYIRFRDSDDDDDNYDVKKTD